MLSAFRSGTPSTPFEIYCTQGLAYVVGRVHGQMGALLAEKAHAASPVIADVQVQAPLAGASFADLLVTFDSGERALIDAQVEIGGSTDHLRTLEDASREDGGQLALIRLALPGDEAGDGWSALSWSELAFALDGDDDPIARQYGEFVERDILGQGDVPLGEALTTNRLYAVSASALRRKYQNRVAYQSSASPPLKGRFRYIGTTFGLGERSAEYWIGLVNETVPLSEHYHLMLASRERALDKPVSQPRATGDWKWAHWTGLGRVVRPLAPENFDELLSRLPQ